MAQDDSKKKVEKEFNVFQDKITNDFGDFKGKSDSIFLRFLETSWKEFKLFKEDKKIRVKPVEQPVAVDLKGNVEEPPEKNNIQLDQQPGQPEPDQPGETASGQTMETTKPGEKPDYTTGIDFFGQLVELPANNDLPSVRSINTADIINYYKSYLLNKPIINSTGAIYQFSTIS